jgi:hypothetical protein
LLGPERVDLDQLEQKLGSVRLLLAFSIEISPGIGIKVSDLRRIAASGSVELPFHREVARGIPWIFRQRRFYVIERNLTANYP